MTTRAYKMTERVSAREVEGELILLDLDDGDFFVARGTSPRIWDLLITGTPIEQIVEQICARYPTIDRTTAEADVASFVDDLVGRGFLQPAG